MYLLDSLSAAQKVSSVIICYRLISEAPSRVAITETWRAVHFSNSAEAACNHDVVFLAHAHETKEILLHAYMLFQAFHF